ncbi:NADH-quinone oxidoreductase subunit L [Cystobacter ferrugineus]|uniref:Na+/H+ antiporter subunit A n=1 Tax=Cystobacter ferrugineus TaxID=83449 RepID=A0A1L9B2L3_9BACT|nr:hydrogen gas-evolving membrane-bound hydrogenase subunit E [Cystobacter ferrugineus]OJH36515.1 Na+/H+ antiporter subunit A [Cystobacter ferrugineus]
MTVVLPLLLVLSGVALVLGVGAWRPSWAGPVGALCSAAGLGAFLRARAVGFAAVSLEWIPTWNVRLALALDGLSFLYGTLVLGVGLLVLVYACAYLPHYLEERHRPRRDEVRLYAWVLVFMGAMLLLVMARDALLLVIALDLTTVASYFLIGYDRERTGSRSAALMALIVTGGTSVVLLAGVVSLGLACGTFELSELAARAPGGTRLTVALGCLAVGALAKSAQVPLHFWLPRAMAAPTPVSAYLHSAAMVAAGVFVLQRFLPVFALAPAVLQGLAAVGLLSMLVGSLFSLCAWRFKRVLAYSTIAQYGYVLVLVGLGGAGAPLYVLAHGLCKAALFLTVGAVTHATGEESLEKVGGLWRSLPGLAGASAVAAAGLAGLPLTLGFFKDELFFRALVERGGAWSAAGVLGAALTLAYTGRLWTGLFLGAPRGAGGHASWGLVAPVGVLGAGVLLGGVWLGPLNGLADAAEGEMFGHPAPLKLAYHLDARAENLLALGAWVLGAGVLVTRRRWEAPLEALTRAASQVGVERAYGALLAGADALSDGLRRLEVRDLRDRVASVLVPAGLLGAAALVTTPGRGPLFSWGPGVGLADVPLVLGLLIAAGAAVATLRAANHLHLVMLLSCVGFSLAAVFAFAAAPDVAFTAVLVETTFTLLFLALLSRLPRHSQERAQVEATRTRWRDWVFAGVAGVSATATSWNALSHLHEERVVSAHVAWTEAAHARDVVSAIITDFRGLDTVGETSVMVVVLLGIIHLLTGERAE